jgi:hypothetical protein
VWLPWWLMLVSRIGAVRPPADTGAPQTQTPGKPQPPRVAT